jgi:hypothetical protein
VIKRFPELQWIDQGFPFSVLQVMLSQLGTGKQKNRYLFTVSPEADMLQIGAHAQVIRPSKKIRGLNVVGRH